DIKNIYECDSVSHLPLVGDWHTLNPSAPVGSLIKKYAPQTQSGTYSFFKSQFLGGLDVDTNCDNSHKPTFLEEHDARGVAAANKVNAILPFSFAQWTSDSKGATPDLRNKVTLQQLDGSAPNASTINEQATGTAGHFNGTRYVHNVLNTGNDLY